MNVSSWLPERSMFTSQRSHAEGQGCNTSLAQGTTGVLNSPIFTNLLCMYTHPDVVEHVNPLRESHQYVHGDAILQSRPVIQPKDHGPPKTSQPFSVGAERPAVNSQQKALLAMRSPSGDSPKQDHLEDFSFLAPHVNQHLLNALQTQPKTSSAHVEMLLVCLRQVVSAKEKQQEDMNEQAAQIREMKTNIAKVESQYADLQISFQEEVSANAAAQLGREQEQHVAEQRFALCEAERSSHANTLVEMEELRQSLDDSVRSCAQARAENAELRGELGDARESEALAQTHMTELRQSLAYEVSALVDVQQENDQLRQCLSDQMNASEIVAEGAQFPKIIGNVRVTQAEDRDVLQNNNEVSKPGNSEKDVSDGDVRPWLNAVMNRSNIGVSTQADTNIAFPRVSKRPVLARAKASSSSGASGESTPSRGYGRSISHNALPPRAGVHQLHLPDFKIF